MVGSWTLGKGGCRHASGFLYRHHGASGTALAQALTVRTTLPCHLLLLRALDEDSEEDLSYKRHASAASAATSAAGAVAAYEAGRRAAAAEAAAARRGLVEARAAIDAKQRAVVSGAGGGSAKALSDRLSGYIQNDVDRLLAGLPTSTEPGHTAELPRYVRHTASSGAAAAGAGPGAAAAVGAGSASVIKPARLMAPLYEVGRGGGGST